jgi:hypothetical protein
LVIFLRIFDWRDWILEMFEGLGIIVKIFFCIFEMQKCGFFKLNCSLTL